MPSKEPICRQSYKDLLEQLKTCFPVPVSNPVMDGYFVHTVSRFLDRVDSLKSSMPILGSLDPQAFEGSFEEGFPEGMSSVEEVNEAVADYCRGMTVWAHPNAQVNVIVPTSLPSITAFIAAAIYNPNIIWDENSARFAEAEVRAVAMLSDLVGYDPRRSGGIFTFGGTGTILYGCKIALEKLFDRRSMTEGIREDVKIVASESSHYSRLTVAGWLGLGTKNILTIPATRDNEMSLTELERSLRRAFEAGEKVALILATLGTTDAFGIDNLSAIVRLRDRLSAEYGLEHPPHIHADAVIGWTWSVFRDYDFMNNPLGFHARTLRALQDSLRRIGDLSLADSLGIDFHKTGYAPYITSIFIVKDREDLSFLSREPEQMPYLYQFGRYHPGLYTLECSRSGASALAVLANMRLFGKQGYRVLIGHVVEMAEMLRERLEAYPFIKVLNDFNYGPVTLFRVYPEGMGGEETFRRELGDPSFADQLGELNGFNRRIFDLVRERAMQGEGVLLAWTGAYRHATYAAGASAPIGAMKSFIMSPWTDLRVVDLVVREVVEARAQVLKE